MAVFFRVLAAAILGLCLGVALPSLYTPVHIETHAVRFGETTIPLVRTWWKNPDQIAYLIMHDNETTARRAGLRHIMQQGGVLYELDNLGLRNITFRVAGKSYRIDPNRIFTPRGAESSLNTLNGRHWRKQQAEVLAAVRSGATALLREWAGFSAIIAIHNNRHDSARFLAHDPLIETIHWPKGVNDSHEFFHVTFRADSAFLASRGYAVICQDHAKACVAEGDGSFSAFCGRRGIRYINVEASPFSQTEQEKMLAAAWQSIKKSWD